MEKTIATLAILAASCAPSLAGTGVWYKDNLWLVEANSDYGYCTVDTVYKSGRLLSMAFNKGQVDLFISGVPVAKDQAFAADVAASNGLSGHFTGVGLGGGVVSFPGLNFEAVLGLAKSDRIYIEGIGSLAMKGSYNAILKGFECYEAMKETL